MKFRTSRFALALLPLLIFVGCNCQVGSSGNKYTRSETVTVPAAALTQLEVNSVNGEIEVVAWDKGEVSIEVTRFLYAENQAEADKRFDDQPFTPVTNGSTLELSWRPKKKGDKNNVTVFGIRLNRGSKGGADYKIQVPRKFAAELATVNGRVSVADLSGNVEMASVNGSLNAQNIVGNVSAETVNGRVTLEGLKGGFSVQSVNGKIKVALAEVPPMGNSSMETVNGSSTLWMPQGAAVSLSAETINGGIEAPQGWDVKKSGFAGKQVTETVNGGGHRVNLETINGRIQIAYAN
jgi:hypothetical protein